MTQGRCAIYNGVYYPVDASFTEKDALKHWKRWKPEVQAKVPAEDWTWKVPNSKGNGHYNVSFSSAGWSCTCTGFGFRRRCRHIDEKKKQF